MLSTSKFKDKANELLQRGVTWGSDGLCHLQNITDTINLYCKIKPVQLAINWQTKRPHIHGGKVKQRSCIHKTF